MKKYYFIHIPKCAGLSVCRAIGMRDDYIHHKRLRKVPPHFIDEKTYVFATVRNPYDRAISVASFLRERAWDRYSDDHPLNILDKDDYINDFWENYVQDFHIETGILFSNQISFLEGEETGRISSRIDKVLHYDTLHQEWAQLRSDFGWGELPHYHKSHFRPDGSPSDILSEASRKRIANYYGCDFKALGYDLNLPVGINKTMRVKLRPKRKPSGG